MELSGPSMNLRSSTPPPEQPRTTPALTFWQWALATWRRVRLAVVASVVVAVLASFSITSMANATPAPTSSLSPDGKTLTTSQTYTDQCTKTDTGTTCVKGSSVTTSQQIDSHFDKASVTETVTLEYMSETGMPAAIVKKAEKLGQCTWMSGGWNSGNGWRVENGKLVKKTGVWRDNTRQRVCHTGRGPSGYQVVGCNNDYWPKGMTPAAKYPRYVKVKLVKHLTQTFTGRASASSSATASSTSTSDANTNYCKAHGSGSFVATSQSSSEAAFSITVTLKTDIKAKLAAVFVKLALKQQAKVTGDAWTQASSKAQGEARSDASCKDIVPPVVTVTIPAQPVPTITATVTQIVTASATPLPAVTITKEVPGAKETIIKEVPGPTPTVTVTVTMTPSAPPSDAPKPQNPSVEITNLNQVQWGGFTDNTTVRYNVPGNGSATITVGMNSGHVGNLSGGGTINSDGTASFMVSGSGTVSFTYYASSDKDLEQGGNATVTATIRANGTGASASNSTNVVIKPKPAPNVGD